MESGEPTHISGAFRECNLPWLFGSDWIVKPSSTGNRCSSPSIRKPDSTVNLVYLMGSPSAQERSNATVRSGPMRTAALRTSFAKSSNSVGNPTPAAIRPMFVLTSFRPSTEVTKGSSIDLSVSTSLSKPSGGVTLVKSHPRDNAGIGEFQALR